MSHISRPTQQRTTKMIFWQNLYILGSLEDKQKKLETDQKNGKKNWSVSETNQFFFWSTKIFFWSTKKIEKLVYQRDWPKVHGRRSNFFLVYQIFFGWPIFFLSTKFFFWWPKKWEIDLTIGIQKRLTKITWTPLSV